MTKTELVKKVRHHRDQLLYSICFDENDFNSIRRYIEKIISELGAAFLANPEEYVNLEMYIDRLKNIIDKKTEHQKDKYLCKTVRREVLRDLKSFIYDNSQKSGSQNSDLDPK
jgi:hypothetical protein